MMKTVMVTGGFGFMGSHYTEHLIQQEGIKVIVIDKLTYAADKRRLSGLEEDYDYDYAGIENLSGYEMDVYKPDLVINFAAETHVDRSIEDSHHFVISNVLGVQNLIRLCAERKIPLLQISTDEVYGELSSSMDAFLEDDRVKPRNPYSATKAAGEHLIRAAGNTNDLQYVILRSCNVFGDKQHPEKFIPKSIRLMEERQPIQIHKTLPFRQWFYVKDFAKTVDVVREKLLSESKEEVLGHVFNIGSPDFYSVAEVAKQLQRKFYKSFKEETNPPDLQYIPDRKGNDFAYRVDYDKFERFFGRINHTPFDLALSVTIFDEVDWIENTRVR